MLLTIIVPVYNEERTVVKVLERLANLSLGIKKEIIIVNDGSTDNSRNLIENFIKEHKKSEFKLMNKENGGKGSALRMGINAAKGDIVTIQDADLEYNPKEYKRLIMPIIQGDADVVYGSRFMLKHKPVYRIYFWGNKLLTFLTKILYNAKITDMETCYKVFRRDVIKNLGLKSDKFDIEPEITAKVLNKHIKILEIPISYKPRLIEEGKKIGWKDGISAVYSLIYWRVIA